MDKNDILKICQSAGYTEGTLIYGGFVNGKHYVSYGQDDAEELQDVGATPGPFATPVFLNKLAACYFAKCLSVSEMRKQTHAKSHEKTWDLAWHLVRCCASNDLIISK